MGARHSAYDRLRRALWRETGVGCLEAGSNLMVASRAPTRPAWLDSLHMDNWRADPDFGASLSGAQVEQSQGRCLLWSHLSVARLDA
jgi:hypothetical protein